MKLRLFVYGLLILAICALATGYLVYTNQDRLLAAARFKMTSLVRERWGLNLSFGESHLNLYRNAVVFESVSLGTEEDPLSLKAGSVEMLYSLRQLLRGTVHFDEVHIDKPTLVLRPSEEEAELPSRRPRLDEALATLALARKLDLEKGTVIIVGPGGREQFWADGLGMRLEAQQEGIRVRTWAQRLKVSHGAYRGLFRQVFLGGLLNGQGLTVKRLDLGSDAGLLRASGRVGKDLDVAADFSFKEDVGKFLQSFEKPPRLVGQAEGSGHLEWRPGGWRAEGEVTTGGLDIAGSPVPDCRAAYGLTADRCLFSDIVNRSGEAGSLRGKGELAWTDREFSYAFTVSAAGVRPAEVGYVRRHFPERLLAPVGPLSGEVRFSGAIAYGGAESWEVHLGLRGQAERYFGPATAAVSGSVFSPDGRQRLLRNFSLTAGPLQASWAGTMDHDRNVSVAFIAETGDLSATLSPFLPGWLGGRASFAGDLTGRLDEPELSGGLAVEPAIVRGVPFESIRGLVGYGGGTFTVRELAVKANGGKATIRGSLAPWDGALFDATANLEGMDAGLLQRLFGLDLRAEGPVTGQLSGRGTPHAYSGRARLTSPAVNLAGRAFGDLYAEGTFNEAGVRFQRLAAVYRGGRGEYSGFLGREGKVEGRLHGLIPELGAWLPGKDFAGAVEYDLFLEGLLSDPDAAGSINWRKPRIGGLSWADLRIDVDKKGGRVIGRTSLGDKLPLQLELDLKPPRPLTGRLSFEDLDLRALQPFLSPERRARIDAYAKPYEGRATGEVTFALPLDDPGAFTGQARIDRLTLMLGKDVSRLKGPARLTFARNSLELEKTGFEGELHRFSVQGRLRDGQLSVALNGVLDISLLAARFDRVREMDLKPELSLTITGPLDDPRIAGSGRFRDGLLGIKGLDTDLKDLSGQLAFDRDGIQVNDLTFTFNQKLVTGKAWIGLKEGRIRANLGGSLPLSSLGRPLPGVKEYDGQARFEGQLSAGPSGYSIDAEVDVEGGLLRLEGFQTPLRDISLKASISDEYIRVRQASASLNGGRLSATGYLVWPWGGRPEDVNFDIVTDKMLLSYPDTLKVVSSARVNFRGSPGGYFLEGEMRLERGKYFRDISPRPVLAGGGQTVFPIERPKAGAALSNLGLNLHLVCDEDFWIDNNIARINTGFDLWVRGQVGEPLLSGEISFREGFIHYLGKKFTLSEASLIFPEKYPPDPYLNIQAQTIVSSVTISLVVQGNLSALKLDFYSDPPYGREDIIALLTLGAPRSFLDDKGRDVSALGAMMVFSGPFIGKFEDQARAVTGLEVFQIEPTLSDTGGAARVILGKQLSDRIFLSYSRNLADAADEQFSVEYRLLDFFSLVGRQDWDGVYSFDVVFGVDVRRWGPR